MRLSPREFAEPREGGSLEGPATGSISSSQEELPNEEVSLLVQQRGPLSSSAGFEVKRIRLENIREETAESFSSGDEGVGERRVALSKGSARGGVRSGRRSYSAQFSLTRVGSLKSCRSQRDLHTSGRTAQLLPASDITRSQ